MEVLLLGMLLFVIITATSASDSSSDSSDSSSDSSDSSSNKASDSSSNSSSRNSSTTTAAAMLFQAVQYLQPLPESWSPDVPLDEWEGVTVATPPNCVVFPGMPSTLYSIVVDARNFSSDSTLRLDLLDPKAPMCNMTVLSSSVASIIVMINASHLPLSLQFLDLSQTEVVTTSPFSQRYVDFAKLPSFIGYVDLSHTGIGGNLDLSLIGQTEGVTFKYVNVSGNVGLVGGVDLTAAAGPLIDLRGTGITTIVVQASQQHMVGPSQSNEPDHTIFVDASVRVLPVTTEEVFLLEVGYYCVPPPNTSVTTDRAMLNVYQSNGQYMLRMIDPPYECETPFDPIVTFNEGYLLKSTTLAMLLYPCMDDLSMDYMQRLMYPGMQIGAINAAGNAIAIFGSCRHLEVGKNSATAQYYSVTLSENSFMDFNNTGYNVTTRGYHESGEIATCVFAWPLYVDNNTQEDRSLIWNDGQLILDLAPCLPRTLRANIVFSNWTSVTYLKSPSSVMFTDGVGNVLQLYTATSMPGEVFTPFTYDTALEFCFVTSFWRYRWTVSAFSTTISIDHHHDQYCTYNGILQHQAIPPGSNPSINCGFYAFDSVISSLGPCLASLLSESNWSSITSGATFTDTTFTTVKSIQIVDDFGDATTFLANGCINYTMTAEVSGTWCSSVDYNTGSLVLDIDPFHSAHLAYYRQSATNPLVQLVTTCDYSKDVSGNPFYFDNEGNVFFVDDFDYYLDLCIPRSTNSAPFARSIARITYSASLGTITIESDNRALVQLSQSACNLSIPIKPEDVITCPEIPLLTDSPLVSDVCIAGSCRSMRSVEWAPEAAGRSSGGSSWSTGSAAVGADVELQTMTQSLFPVGTTIAACYPRCFIDTSDCYQAAFFMAQMLMCYARRGETIPWGDEFAITSSLSGGCGYMPFFTAIEQMMNGEQSNVQLYCTPGGVALTTNNAVLATSYGVTTYTTTLYNSDGDTISGTVNTIVGLRARCTPCVSLWLENLYPSPLFIIAINSVANVLLVFIANRYLEPVIGPRLVKLRAKLTSILGSLSPREAKANEKWMLKSLDPYMASQFDVAMHIDMVCTFVNHQRSLRNLVVGGGEGATSDAGALQNRTGTKSMGAKVPSSTGDPTPSVVIHRQEENEEMPKAPNVTAHQQEDEEMPKDCSVAADAVFRSILVKNIMGARMLACVSEASVARLVELRDCCELDQEKPIARKRSFRFPIGEEREIDVVMPQEAVERNLGEDLLEKNTDDIELINEFDDGISKTFAQSQQSLEDVMTAILTDTTIEWQPYLFAEEWLINKFLLTKDWMFFLNTIILIALMGRALHVVNSSPTTNGSWEGYNEFYFLLLDGSTPVALLINAVFRVYHSKRLHSVTVTNDYRKLLHSMLMDPFLMIPVICLLPAFLTHIIPGLLIFPFLPIVGIALVAASMKIRTKLPSNVDTLHGKLLRHSATTIGCIARQVILRQVVMFVSTAGVQFAFNYMMMFYAARSGTLTVSSGSWAGIIAADFDARSTVCVLEQLEKSVETSWNLVYSQFL